MLENLLYSEGDFCKQQMHSVRWGEDEERSLRQYLYINASHFQMGAPDSLINFFAINIISVQFLYTFQKP